MRSEIRSGIPSGGPFSVLIGSISIFFGFPDSWKFVLFDFLIFRRSTWILRQPERIQTVIFTSTVLRHHAVDFLGAESSYFLMIVFLGRSTWILRSHMVNPTIHSTSCLISLLYHGLSLRNRFKIHADVRKMKNTNVYDTKTRNTAKNHQKLSRTIITIWIIYSGELLHTHLNKILWTK